MASTIGTGGGFDYTTVTDWEAALGGGGADDEGQMNNEAFDEGFTIDAGTNPILTHEPGDGHDFSEGSGARFVQTGANVITLNRATVTFRHLECDANGNGPSRIVDVNSAANVVRCMVHSGQNNGFMYAIEAIAGTVINTCVYDVNITANNQHGWGIRDAGTATNEFSNCTVDNIDSPSASGTRGDGIECENETSKTYRNNIATRCENVDFDAAGMTNPTFATNASSDSTAPDPIAAEPVVAADEFTSLATPDYRLKSGAESIDAGTDLGTSPTDIEVDILLRDRDAQGDVWDLGCHEFVAAVTDLPRPAPNLNQAVETAGYY